MQLAIAIAIFVIVGNGPIYKEPKTGAANHTNANTSLLDFFIPIVILLGFIFVGILFSGNWSLFGGTRGLIAALQHSSAAIALFTGGVGALIVCTAFFLLRKKISFIAIPKIYWEGIWVMATAIVILLLAWTLGDILRNNLYTGQYLAHLMVGAVSINFLPAIFFVTATIITFCIGSSWGTAAMLFPIAIPLTVTMSGFQEIPTLYEIPVLFPILGSVLAGCVAGDHISPISTTTIMSAISSRSPPIEHFRTQLPYAIPVLLATAIAFLFTTHLLQYGLWISVGVPVLIGLALAIVMLQLLNKAK